MRSILGFHCAIEYVMSRWENDDGVNTASNPVLSILSLLVQLDNQRSLLYTNLMEIKIFIWLLAFVTWFNSVCNCWSPAFLIGRWILWAKQLLYKLEILPAMALMKWRLKNEGNGSALLALRYFHVQRHYIKKFQLQQVNFIICNGGSTNFVLYLPWLAKV